MYKYHLFIIIPVICAACAWLGCGYLFRTGVAGCCAALLLSMPNAAVKKTVWLVIASFLFSIGGDWFLSHMKHIPARFIYGIILFFVAHAGFLIFCLKNGKMDQVFLYGILTIYIASFSILIKPFIHHQPVLLVAVLLYMVVSCCSLAAAMGLQLQPSVKWLFVSGIASLVFSDTCIALHRFSGYEFPQHLVMPTYYASHILITAALIKTLPPACKKNE